MNPIEDKIFRLEILNYQYKEGEAHLKTITHWLDKLNLWNEMHEKRGRSEQSELCKNMVNQLIFEGNRIADQINRILHKI